MADTSRLRWLVLGSALIGTIVVSLMPVAEPIPHVARAGRATRAAAEVRQPVIVQTREADPVGVDPFAPRGWQNDPPAPVVAVSMASVKPFIGPPSPPPATPRAPPPPLPFQFIGRLTDDSAPVVYLTHGEQTLVARSGETLEHTYKVLGFGPNQIEFLYLPTGEKQLMGLPVAGD